MKSNFQVFRGSSALAVPVLAILWFWFFCAEMLGKFSAPVFHSQSISLDHLSELGSKSEILRKEPGSPCNHSREKDRSRRKIGWPLTFLGREIRLNYNYMLRAEAKFQRYPRYCWELHDRL